MWEWGVGKEEGVPIKPATVLRLHLSVGCYINPPSLPKRKLGRQAELRQNRPQINKKLGQNGVILDPTQKFLQTSYR